MKMENYCITLLLQNNVGFVPLKIYSECHCLSAYLRQRNVCIPGRLAAEDVNMPGNSIFKRFAFLLKYFIVNAP